MPAKRHRAGAIVIHHGAVLLMHRVKEGREYYVVPGGGIEGDESPEMACVREMLEETGLRVSNLRPFHLVDRDGNLEHYYLVGDWEGEPVIGGPEKERQSEDNRYRLEWVEVARLAELPLLPEEIKQAILERLDDP